MSAMSEPAGVAHLLSYAEYLELEGAAEERHIFWDGEIFATSGGSENHTALEANLVALLRDALRGAPCRAHTGNRRLRSLSRAERSVYPDAVVICGPSVPHPADHLASTNPSVVVEVLSDSTESFDRGKKFAYYRTFPTLRSVVLVSQHEVRVEHFHRPEGLDTWAITELGPGEALELPDIRATLPLDEIYEGVVLPGAE